MSSLHGAPGASTMDHMAKNSRGKAILRDSPSCFSVVNLKNRKVMKMFENFMSAEKRIIPNSTVTLVAR